MMLDYIILAVVVTFGAAFVVSLAVLCWRVGIVLGCTYYVLAIVSILGTILHFIIAPITALSVFMTTRVGRIDNGGSTGIATYFICSENSNRLFYVLQTPDNPQEGDKGWQSEHWQWRYKLPRLMQEYVGRFGWQWRNPFYGYKVLAGKAMPPLAERNFTTSGNLKYDSEGNGLGWYYITSSNPPAFEYRTNFRVVCKYGVKLKLGWGLRAFVTAENYKDNRAWLDCSISPRTVKEV